MDESNKIELTTYITIAVALLFWASSFAAIRFALVTPDNPQGYSPGSMALLRFATASVMAIVYLAVTGKGFPARKDMGRIFVAGFFGIALYHPVLNFCEQTVQAGAAAVVIASSPIFTALLSTVFLKERLTVWGWVGIMCSFAGVVVISMGGTHGLQLDPRALLLIVSAASTSIYMVLSKKPLRTYSGVQFTAYAIIAGTIPMLIFAPQLASEIQVAPTTSTIAVVYMGIAPGFLAYALWNIVLSRMPATALAVFLNFQPLLAAGIAWAWLGEVPTYMAVIGGIIAITGVVLVQRFGEKDWKPEDLSLNVGTEELATEEV